MAIGNCRECGGGVSSEAKVCSQCGAKKPAVKSVGPVGLLLASVVGITALQCATPDVPKAASEQIKASSATAPPSITPMTPDQRCNEGIAAVIREAKADIAAGMLTYAINELTVCDKIKSRPELQQLIKEANSKVALNNRMMEKKATEEKARKRREGVNIGMSMQDALDSSWGRPKKVNRTTGSYGTHEQWVYDGGYLYFENGVLRTIQN
jgi:hypothetical protein